MPPEESSVILKCERLLDALESPWLMVDASVTPHTIDAQDVADMKVCLMVLQNLLSNQVAG